MRGDQTEGGQVAASFFFPATGSWIVTEGPGADPPEWLLFGDVVERADGLCVCDCLTLRCAWALFCDLS